MQHLSIYFNVLSPEIFNVIFLDHFVTTDSATAL